MLINQLNTSLHGGAAVAALRLHRALLAADVDSRLWHGPKAKAAAGDIQCQPLPAPSPAWRAWLRKLQLKWDKRRFLRGRSRDFEIFTDARAAVQAPFSLAGDVLHLHWIASWIDYPSFFAGIPDEQPIVWTLHDMNPMTGGCHHADACTAYSAGCQHCPQLAKSSARDFAWQTFERKRHAFAGKNIHVVTPSRWLEGLVRQSDLLGNAASIQTIRNGLDLQIFAPRNKQQSRRELQLPDDAIVVGFGAASLKNRRKGFAELLTALSKMSDKRRFMGLGFGQHELPDLGLELPSMTTVGYLNDPRRQALVYSAMDMFVLPSWAENLPQTAVEALACGTPVVAFDVGGVPEIVRPGQTGVLAPLHDCEALSQAIQWMADHPDARQRMGRAAQDLVRREFEINMQRDRYLELYRSLITDKKSIPSPRKPRVVETGELSHEKKEAWKGCHVS